jgi:hypothetical protein
MKFNVMPLPICTVIRAVQALWKSFVFIYVTKLQFIHSTAKFCVVYKGNN